GEAVDARHHGVDEHEFRLQLVDEVEGFEPVARLVDGEPGRLQGFAHQEAMHDVVVGDEDVGWVAGPGGGWHQAVCRHFPFSSRSVSRSAVLTLRYSVSMRTRRVSASARSLCRALPSISAMCCASCFAPRLALLDFNPWAIFQTAEASPLATERRSSSSAAGAFSRYMSIARSSTDGPSPRRSVRR